MFPFNFEEQWNSDVGFAVDCGGGGGEKRMQYSLFGQH